MALNGNRNDDNGKVKEIRFKDPNYQPTPAFIEGDEKLHQLKSAIREVIKESIN